MWSNIWSSPVPQKIRIFAWRLAKDALAMRKNKFRRTLEASGTCVICGQGDEDGHHAVVMCTTARALQEEMRKIWELPPEWKFRKSGPDWLLLLLDMVPKATMANIM